jgi:hypothetical protein
MAAVLSPKKNWRVGVLVGVVDLIKGLLKHISMNLIEQEMTPAYP